MRESKAPARGRRAVRQMPDPAGVRVGRASHQAPHLVALGEQQLGEVRAVLPGDPGDERLLQPTSRRIASWWARERVDQRVEAARSGLEHPGGVDRHAVEAGLADPAGDGGHLLRLGPESLGGAVVAARRRRRLRLEAERGGIAARLLGVALDGGDVAARLLEVGGRAHGEPSVAEPTGAPQRRRRRAADPDRQLPTLRRFGLHRDGLHRIERSRRVDRVFAPVPAQQRDRLVHPRAALVEVDPLSVVLGLLPAHSDPQPHPAARQRVERRDLLRHQRRVSLRQHQHLGAEADPAGDRGAVGERHQRLEDRHLGRIRAGRPPVGGVAHHHVIEHVELVVADVLDRLGEADGGLGTFAIDDTGKLDRDLHSFPPTETGSLARTAGMQRAVELADLAKICACDRQRRQQLFEVSPPLPDPLRYRPR